VCFLIPTTFFEAAATDFSCFLMTFSCFLTTFLESLTFVTTWILVEAFWTFLTATSVCFLIFSLHLLSEQSWSISLLVFFSDVFFTVPVFKHCLLQVSMKDDWHFSTVDFAVAL